MPFSTYMANAINDSIFNAAAFPSIATVYMKLHLGDPGAAGTANASVETTRKATSWGASSSGVVTNDADITWTSVAASEDHTHFSLWDASTGGNCLGSGTITADAAVSGNDYTIPSGSATWTTATS